MPIMITCAYCGEQKPRTPSKAKRREKHFCNKDHETKYKQTPEGKAWIRRNQKAPNVRIPHWRSKKQKVIKI